MRKCFVLALAFVSMASWGKITAKDAKVRVMPPGMEVTAAFVTLENDGDQDVSLVEVRADFAKTVELHTHVVEEGIMQMRKTEKMKVPKKGELLLKPHGKHLMIFGVKEKLKKGQEKTMKLKFSDGSELPVKFKAVEIK